ncbi:hypothetical protein QP090_07785 [Actinomadura xylanilytica]|nr:hypothetical protein [Actinomadura xylanilytica]MDL4772058.1 hypothetical protein [Actinomadura xylanilytica]
MPMAVRPAARTHGVAQLGDPAGHLIQRAGGVKRKRIESSSAPRPLGDSGEPPVDEGGECLDDARLAAKPVAIPDQRRHPGRGGGSTEVRLSGTFTSVIRGHPPSGGVAGLSPTGGLSGLSEQGADGVRERRAVEELFGQVGADLVERTAVTVALEPVGGCADLVVDRVGVCGRQVQQRQIGRSRRRLPHLEPPVLHRRRSPVFDGRGREALHDPVHLAAELSGGLVGRAVQNGLFDTSGDAVGHPVGQVADHPRLRQVDAARLQRSPCSGEVGAQPPGEVHQRRGGVPGDGQRGGDLLSRRLERGQHPVIGITVTFGPLAAVGELGDRGQFTCLRPSGLPTRRRRHLEKLGIGQATQPIPVARQAHRQLRPRREPAPTAPFTLRLNELGELHGHSHQEFTPLPSNVFLHPIISTEILSSDILDRIVF